MARTNPQIASPVAPPNLALRTVDKPKMQVTGASWTITLSRKSTLIEMATVMARFNCHAEVLDNGDVRLWPFDSAAGWPTAQEVAELMQSGLTAEHSTTKEPTHAHPDQTAA